MVIILIKIVAIYTNFWYGLNDILKNLSMFKNSFFYYCLIYNVNNVSNSRYNYLIYNINNIKNNCYKRSNNALIQFKILKFYYRILF